MGRSWKNKEIEDREPKRRGRPPKEDKPPDLIWDKRRETVSGAS